MSTEKPEPQKPLSQPALAAAGEVGRRIPAVGLVPGRDEGAASPNPTRGGAFEEREPNARGIELLVQRQNLLHEAAGGCNTDSRIRAFEALAAWDEARTDAEWDLMRVAQFGAGKVGLRRLVERYADVEPIGQRR